MPFIGPKPADTVLDSTLIADGSITSAKIADGAIAVSYTHLTLPTNREV